MKSAARSPLPRRLRPAGKARENAMQLLELGVFLAAMIVLVVCGCIFTRRPKESPQSAAQPGKKEAAEPPIGA